MNELMDKLHNGGYSCVVSNGGQIRTFSQRGVADLYELLMTDASFLLGAHVADKVVGRAAAAILVAGKVRALSVDVISEPAIELLQQANVQLEYSVRVEHIINRTKTDMCPLEKRTQNCKSVKAVLAEISAFLKDMQQK